MLKQNDRKRSLDFLEEMVGRIWMLRAILMTA